MTATKSRRIRLPPDENWVTTERAAEMLCVSEATMQRLPRGSIRRRVRSPGRDEAVGSGYLWSRAEVEVTARLRMGARLSLNSAVRVMAWVRDNEITITDEFLRSLGKTPTDNGGARSNGNP